MLNFGIMNNLFDYSFGFSGAMNPFSFSAFSTPFMNTPLLGGGFTSFLGGMGMQMFNFAPTMGGGQQGNWMNCWANMGLTSFSYNAGGASSSSSSSKRESSTAKEYRDAIVKKAASYIGKVNSDAEGNRLFSPKGYKNTSWYKQKGRWGWCADFATYVAQEVYGDKLPKGFKTSSPQGLINWADRNSCYKRPPSTGRGEWIAKNVKPGDILICAGKGDSGLHVAIVSEVHDDGSFTTIDGNSKNSVRKSNRKSSGNFKGFVCLDKFAT